MKRPRRRRLRRWLVGIALGAIAFRVLLALLLPWLIGLAAGSAGLAVAYRSASLSLLGLSLQLQGVVVRDANDGTAPVLVSADEIAVDVSARQLLRGDIVVVDAALAGARIELERRPDGTMRLPAAWRSEQGAPVPTATEPREPIRFDLPLHILTARVHDLRIGFADLQATPPRRHELAVDVDARDLGHPDHAGTVEIRLHAPASLDDFWLHFDVRTATESLEVAWHGALRGVRPDAAVRTLLPDVRALGLDLRGEFHARRAAAMPTFASFGGGLAVRATADGRPLVSLDALVADSQPGASGEEVPFSIDVRGDDLVDELRLRDGRLLLATARTTLSSELVCRGLSLRRVAPWLQRVGVQLPGDGLGATAKLRVEAVHATGTPSVSAFLDDVALWHGDDRAALAHFAIEDVRHANQRLAIEAIAITGPDLTVTALANGSVEVAGVRLSAPNTAPAADGAAGTASPAGSFVWPDVSLRKLAWRGLTLRLGDAALPGASLRLANGTVNGHDLALGHASAPGRLVATCTLPDAIGELRAELRLTPEPSALVGEAHLTAEDVTLAAFAPWLQRQGIEPAMQGGRLRAMATAKVATDERGIAVDATLANVRLEHGGETLLGLRTIDVKGLRIGGTAFELGAWTVLDPTVIGSRGADGAITALGVRFVPVPANAAEAPPSAAPAPTAPVPAPVRATTAPLSLTHGPLVLRGARVRWLDALGAVHRDVAASIDARLDGDDGSGASIAHETTIRVDGAIDALQVLGNLRRSPAALRVEAEVSGRGLRGQGLASMLPPSLRCELDDGTLLARLEADLLLQPQLGVRVRAEGLKLSDREQELAAAAAVVVDVPRLSADHVHVRSLRIEGLAATAATTAEGLRFAGLLLGPTTPAEPPPATAATAASAVPMLPALRIDDLDLSIARFVWRDRSGTDGRPVELSGRLRLAAPWATADDPGETRPASFLVTAAATPLCREATIAIDLAPFLLMPTADVDVRVAGIDTTALAAIVPALAGRLEGTAQNAEFTGKLHAHLDLHRRDVRRFDLARPFGGELVLEDLRLQEQGQEPLFCAELVTVQARTFDPATGELQLRAIECEGARLRAERSAAGLELLGVRLRTASPDSSAPASTPAEARATSAPAFAIDRVHVQDLAVDFLDATTSPASRLPVRNVDVLIRNVSTAALTGARPIDFALSAGGGEVELERRVLRSSLLAGIVGSTVDAIGGNADAHTMEGRPLLDELRASGRVTLGPTPSGEVRAAVRSLELPALRGLAKGSGVDLADGLLDLDVQIELRGGRGMRIAARPLFTWLSLAEPPGGPISTYLRLPVPLDTALFLLRNDADEHVIPVAIEVPPEGVGTGAIAAAAGEALVRVLADAIASAGLRSAGALTGAVGLGGGTAPLPSAALQFAPGEREPTDGSLDEVLSAVAGDAGLAVVLTHEPGTGDLQRAAELGNPPREVVATSLAGLRDERNQLTRHRAQLAAEVAALHAAARMQDARLRHGELAALDARLGDLEAAIDDAVRMLAGDDARARARRTRDAVIATAERRLETVRTLVIARLGAEFAPRVEWRRPRAVPADGLPHGGRVAVVLRKRSPP